MSFEQAIMLGIQLARVNGYEENFEKYYLWLRSSHAGNSDRLRNGSPECGKAMRKKRAVQDTE